LSASPSSGLAGTAAAGRGRGAAPAAASSGWRPVGAAAWPERTQRLRRPTCDVLRLVVGSSSRGAGRASAGAGPARSPRPTSPRHVGATPDGLGLAPRSGAAGGAATARRSPPAARSAGAGGWDRPAGLGPAAAAGAQSERRRAQLRGQAGPGRGKDPGGSGGSQESRDGRHGSPTGGGRGPQAWPEPAERLADRRGATAHDHRDGGGAVMGGGGDWESGRVGAQSRPAGGIANCLSLWERVGVRALHRRRWKAAR
jgi:hypothetical protein